MKPEHNGKRSTALRRAGPGKNGVARKKSAPSATSSYDEFKQFEGQRYTGMKIGRTHKWYYDKGEWREKKVTPDLWQIDYEVKKRRAGKAPEGSGVPVGTAYHWLILAHQNVQKLDANVYSTSMSGMKFKVAHKRADKEKWSASEAAQRRRMIKFLQQMIDELKVQEPKSPSAPARGKKSGTRGKKQPVTA